MRRNGPCAWVLVAGPFPVAERLPPVAAIQLRLPDARTRYGDYSVATEVQECRGASHPSHREVKHCVWDWKEWVILRK